VSSAPSFLERHEFLLRRLHSLTGLIPIGAYMVVHLAVNSSVFGDAMAFQRRVFQIHSLGPILPVIEWLFIFLPIIFHGVYGLVIAKDGNPNNQAYPYNSNFRYTLQRATGIIAFLFIFWHVFHMHGWFHESTWLKYVAEPLAGAQFKPYNASSTAAEAMQASIIVPVLYAIGVLSCVFHLANGIFTFGITWGLWITPKAQTNAKLATNGLGVIIALLGLLPIAGLWSLSNIDEVREKENQAYQILVTTGEIMENDHKRFGEHADDAEDSDVSQIDEASASESR